MMIFALISFLAGIVLGQRFRVLVLIPVGVLISVMAVVVGVLAREAFWPATIVAIAGWASLQMGYFVGLGMRQILSGEGQSHASVGRSAADGRTVL
jgi:hypothetical protein